MKMKIMLSVITLALLSCALPAAAQEQQQPQLQPQSSQQPPTSTQPQEQQQQAPAQKKKGLMSKIFGQDAKSKQNAPKTNDTQPQAGDAKPAPSPTDSGEQPQQSAEPQSSPAEQPATDNAQAQPAATPPIETQASNGQPASPEEAKVASSYSDFFSTYRLGPEDVISVEVFNQPRYSRPNITIPPNGRISLSLIPSGITVSGKTVEEVAEIIRQKYEEYIVDASVSVSLDKAVSYRYSIIGDVAQPGIKPLSRRMTVREALAEAGGVLNTGDSSKVAILRRMPDNKLTTIPVNVKKILQGKLPDDAYLAPGDQIVVPGNTFKKLDQIMKMLPVLSFARIFTGGW